jgi:hypothetical protein
MAGRLDGPGAIKLATLDDAMTHVQRLHAIVERMAIAVRSQQDTGGFRQQLHRAATPLVGLLKPQFGMVAEYVTQLILVATRGGTEQNKVRALREAIASLRQQVEVAAIRVREQHTIKEAPDT